MAVYFWIFFLDKKINLSLGFRIGKFLDSGLLDISYNFYMFFSQIFGLNKIKTRIWGLELEKFSVKISLILFMPIYFFRFCFDKIINLNLGLRIGKFHDGNFRNIIDFFHMAQKTISIEIKK